MKKHNVLIGSLCVAIGVLLSSGAAAFGGLGTGPASGAQTINIRAWIDGRSQLILDDDSVQWQHFDHVAPGRWGCPSGRFQPTVIDGVAWFPQWRDIPDCENKHCGGCLSSLYSGLQLGIPDTEQWINIERIEVRGACTIVEYPHSTNGFRIVLEFNDSPSAAAWYEINVHIEPGMLQSNHIKAWIDGRSQLILDDNSLQWQHFDHVAPGRWGCPSGRFQPTVVDGVDWFPEWPDIPDCQNKHCGGCFSDVYSRLDPGIPDVRQSVFIEEYDVPGAVTVVEQPTAANGFRFVVEFNDNPYGGADWYEIVLARTVLD